MSPTIGLPPPCAPRYLDASRVARFKGGTLIDEDVGELAEHERRVRQPDLYRPACCPRCRCVVLHVHSRPERHPVRDPTLPPAVPILVFECANEACGATWRILPAFLARHLWHPWRVVERTVLPSAAPRAASAPVVPRRTVERWLSRLGTSARVIVAVFAMVGGALEAVSTAVGLGATRGEVAAAFAAADGASTGERLARPAAAVHRCERGVRLM